MSLLKFYFSFSLPVFFCSVRIYFNAPFSIFACCRSLFICDSSLSFHPSFDFKSVVFRRTPSFSLTNLGPAYIKSFNSVTSFVGIFANKSFTFSVSDLTVLQSWFLRRQCSFLFRYDSFNDIYIFFSRSMFLSVCLQCIGCSHVVFGLEFLAFCI